MTEESLPMLDLVGIGFGPANLAIAALHASPAMAAPVGPVHFLERRPSFAWHGDMLLPGATMQVAFAKDLVTPSDPTSPYSFLNYLVVHDRLEQFLNLGTLHASREEFNAYLGWVAGQLDDRVTYGARVEAVEPCLEDGRVTALRVVSTDTATGTRQVRHTRHLAVGTGGRPWIPAGVDPVAVEAGKVFHSSAFLSRMAPFAQRAAAGERLSFLVVGAGQSAAEIVQYLHGTLAGAHVTLAHRGFALQPANSSPLANAVFDPASVDLFFRAGEQVRARIMAELRTTNYACVDSPDLDAIARTLYHQEVSGESRLEISRLTALEECTLDGDRVAVVLSDAEGGTRTQLFDGVVLATGYDFGAPPELLSGVDEWLLRDSSGAIELARDYSAEAKPAFLPRIYLLGASESSHGLTSTLLSIVARRAGLVLDSVGRSLSEQGSGR